MSKFITEMLDEINTDPTTLEKYKDSNALKLLFEYAFNPANKFALPEGVPPYREDSAPIGMSPANFIMETKKLYVFCRTDISNLRRETLFIQLLENVHPSEAKVLLAVKDQKLTTLYKNITHKLLYDNGFVSVEPTMETERKKRGRPKQNGVPVSQEEE